MSNMPGQASDDFKGASSALRILYVGHRNSFAAELTTDGFTQTNPPVVADADARSERLATTPKYGVLSGSVAFTRPDAGNGFVGGPLSDADFTATGADGAQRPLGLFINDAAGNAYENTPGPASGKGPYVSSQGTMGSMLYETNVQTAAFAELTYAAGDLLYASVNGYITNTVADALETVAAVDPTVLGVVKIAPDNAHAEVLFDLRV